MIQNVTLNVNLILNGSEREVKILIPVLKSKWDSISSTICRKKKELQLIKLTKSNDEFVKELIKVCNLYWDVIYPEVRNNLGRGVDILKLTPEKLIIFNFNDETLTISLEYNKENDIFDPIITKLN